MNDTEEKPFFSTEDLKNALAGFLVFFLIMLSYYILKAARSGIFIATWGAEYIPHFLILNAAVSFWASALFGYLTDRVKPKVLVPSIMGFFALNLAGFWTFFRFAGIEAHSSVHFKLAITGIYTLWIGIFSLFTVTPFWSVMNSVFKARQGKVFFGLIGAGGTIGAMAGSHIASSLATTVGSENLIIYSALPLLFVIPAIYSLCGNAIDEGQAKVDDRKTQTDSLEGFKIIRKNSYVMLIAAIVVISTFAISVTDYKVHKVISSSSYTKDQMTAFFGDVYFYVSIVSIITHIGVTPLILNLWGAGAALYLLPAAILGGCFVLFREVSDMSVLAVPFVIILALHYSINQISKELLYIPCDKAIRYKAKSFIDTFGYRLGPVLSAGILLITSKVNSPGLLPGTLIGVIILWFFVISRISLQFKKVSESTKNS